MAEDLHASKTGTLIAADTTLIILSAIAVALRLLARRLSKAGLWYDDYAIMVALPLVWMLPILNLIATRFDFGKHEAVARPDAAKKWYHILYIFENFYAPAIAMVKFSILFFYARIFIEHTNKLPTQVWFRRALEAMGTITFLWWVICQFVVIFECAPIHYFWNRKLVTGHCLNVQVFFQGQAIPNIITDLVLLIMPLPLIWKLRLPIEQKAALSGIFSLGGFVTATSIYRLTLSIKLTQVDITWNYADADVWSAVEPNVAVISACLPMLRPVVKLVGGTFGSMGSLGKKHGHTAGTAGTESNDQPHCRSSVVPTFNAGGPFARLADVPSSSDPIGGKWELWEGRRSKDVQRTILVRRSDKKDMLGQAELGAVPRGAIHVKNEISLQNDESSF